MSSPREVDASKILETAMGLVSSAQSSIQVTMQAAEEIEHPLPREYFLLLQEKMREGVKIIRIGFGSEEEFGKIRDNVQFKNPNYRFQLADSSDYRRMLLIDRTKLMFAKTDLDGRHVFYTEDPSEIAKFEAYFEGHLTA